MIEQGWLDAMPFGILMTDTHRGRARLSWRAARCSGSGQHVRGIDTTARYGGEEFVVNLPERDPAAACQTAERLRQVVSERPLRLALETGPDAAERVTI